MIRKIFISIALAGLFIPASFSQPWLDYLETKKSLSDKGEFYRIQDAFRAYSEGRELEELVGWKQYKRWENFMEPRVYPSGNLHLPVTGLLEASKATKGSDLASWSSLGPHAPAYMMSEEEFNGSGRLNTIAFHPTDPDIMYAGAPSGGCWKTTDGGVSWVTLTDHLVSLGVSDIAIHPEHPDTIYIATGDGDNGDTYGFGIVRSVDGGQTWDTTALNYAYDQQEYFRRLQIDPENLDILYAASNKGFYRLNDATGEIAKLKSGYFKDFEFKPDDSGIIYLAEYGREGSDCRVYRYDVDESSFKHLTNKLSFDKRNYSRRCEIAVSPADPDLVYIVTDDKGWNKNCFYGLYKSTDTGNSWEEVYNQEGYNLFGWARDGSDEKGQAYYDMALAVDPEDANKVYVGGINVWKSEDGGNSFEIVSYHRIDSTLDYMHADHHMLKFSPHNGDLYSCNDGGLYKTSDEGAVWDDLTGNMSILQSYKIAASVTEKDLFLAGNQDNGNFVRRDGKWQAVTRADGMECFIHREDPEKWIVSFYFGQFFKTEDAGLNFEFIVSPLPWGSGAWVTPMLNWAGDPDYLYVGYRDVYRTEQLGVGWIQMSSDLSDRNLEYLDVAPSDNNYLYTGYTRKMWRTKNGGISWQMIHAGLPTDSAAIVSVEVSDNNPEKIWVTLSGFYDGHKVYTSDDAGNTWTNISEGLPNIPANVIRYHGGANPGLYLGTDNGMYYREVSGNEWVRYSNGLPNVVVTDIEFQDTWDRVIVGTYGRGLWESPQYPADETSLSGEIHTRYQFGCLDDPVNFWLNTGDDVESVTWNFNDESTLEAQPGDTVAASFSSPGLKTIVATLHRGAEEQDLRLDNYFTVKEGIDLQITCDFDIDEIKGTDIATFFAYGANTYTWSSTAEIPTPYESSVDIQFTDTAMLYVEGFVGNCSDKDSLLIEPLVAADNDDVCNAFSLLFGENGPFFNRYATIEENEPIPAVTHCNTQESWCVNDSLDNSIWFIFVPDESRSYSLISEGFDTQMALYEAENCNSLLDGSYTLIAANDDYYSEADHYSAALMDVMLEAGKTYYLQVDGGNYGEEGDCSISVVHGTVGIEELPVSKIKKELLIYPNPSSGEVTAKYYTENPSRISVFSATGRKVMEESSDKTGIVEEQISIHEKGVYFIQVFTHDYIFNRKVIIE